MRFPTFGKMYAMALLSAALIGFGGAGLLLAQRQAAPRIIMASPDGTYLGIGLEDVTAGNFAQYKLSGETGVIVQSVEKGSPAEAAHLQENDVILEYAGIPVFSAAELTRLVQETPAGRTLNLVVSRDGRKSDIAIKTGERNDGELARRFNLIGPNDMLRRFDFGSPGRGTFQFDVPGGGTRSYGYVIPSRPRLGITADTLTEQMAEFLGVPGKKGILVTSVTQGTPAAAALRAGDVIVSVDGKSISTPEDLAQEMARKPADARVELRIVRDKKETSVTVNVAKSETQPSGIRV